MKNYILWCVLIAILNGCVLNVKEETKTLITGQSGNGINKLIIDDVPSSNDINIVGVINDTIVADAIIRQLVTYNNSSIDAVTLNVGNDGKLKFDCTSEEWEAIHIDDLTIECRNTMDIDCDISSGDILIEGMVGNIVAEASSGEIDVTTTSGTIKVNASSGDIKATSNGFITADASSGDISITTAKGCSAEASSGDVSVTIVSDTLVFDGITVDVSSGDVKIKLPQTLGVNLSLSVSSGDISIPGNSEIEGSYKGTLNGGGKLVEVDASSGDIDIITY